MINDQNSLCFPCGLVINYSCCAEECSELTLAETRSHACLTSAWSTDSLPSLCTGWSSGSVCFFLISYCTLKFLNACRTKDIIEKDVRVGKVSAMQHYTLSLQVWFTWYLSVRFPSAPWARSTSLSSWSKNTFSSLSIFRSSLCYDQWTSAQTHRN